MMGDIINVSPTESNPTHDISLSDGDNILGFLTATRNGMIYPNLFDVTDAEKTALQVTSGAPSVADTLYPYITSVQETFQGGIGGKIFEKDTSKYVSGHYVDGTGNTLRTAGALFPARLLKKLSGGNLTELSVTQWVRTWKEYFNGVFSYYPIYFNKTSQYQAIASKFTVNQNCTVNRLGAIIYIPNGFTDSPTIVAKIYSDSGGLPGTAIATSGNEYTYNLAERVSYHIFEFGVDVNLSAGNTYHVSIYVTYSQNYLASLDTDNCIQVMRYSELPSTEAAMYNGTSWASAQCYFYFNLYYSFYGVDEDAFIKFFEYKKQLYCIRFVNGTMQIFINGYYGYESMNAPVYPTSAIGYTYDIMGCAIVKVSGNSWDKEYEELDAFGEETYSGLQYALVGGDLWLCIYELSLSSGKPTDVCVHKDTIYISYGGNRKADKFTIKQNGTGYEIMTTTTGIYADYMESVGDDLWVVYNNKHYALAWRDTHSMSYGNSILSGLQIFDCMSALDEQTITNVTNTYEYEAARITIAEAFSTGNVASKAITVDLSKHNKVWFIFRTSINTDDNDYQIVFSKTANLGSIVMTLGLPGGRAGENIIAEIDYDPDTTDIASIVSFGIRQNVNKSACVFQIISPIMAFRDNAPIIINNSDNRITGIECYDNPETLWVFTDNSVGYILGNTTYVQLPLKEMNTVASPDNGMVHTTSDVYLVWNTKNGIMRYYREMIQHIGVNIYPDSMRKFKRVNSIAAMPGGRLFVSAVEEYYDSMITSYVERGVILAYDSNGWHEIFSAQGGYEIKSIYIQSLPHRSYSKLWFDMDSHLYWIPVQMKEGMGEDFPYAPFGSVHVGNFSTRLFDIDKYYGDVRIKSESPESVNILGYYWKHNGTIDNSFDYNDWENENRWTFLGNWTGSNTSYTVGKTAYSLGLRFEIYNYSLYAPTQIDYITVESFGVLKPKRIISFTTVMGDAMNETDKEGNIITTPLSTKLNILLGWKNSPVPLTMRTTLSSLDNLTVQVLSFSYRPLEVSPGENIGDGHEKLLCFIQLVEL